MASIDWSDTIVASATAVGFGSRSILRLSGPEAHSIVQAVSSADTAISNPSFERIEIRLPEYRLVIPAWYYGWPKGRSSTGQEVAELHLDAAGPLVSEVERLILGSGARRARPGEFTLRAFLAGRLDLAEAEGVLGLVEAENVDMLVEAIDLRAGGVSRPIVSVRSDLLDLRADLEAGLDFAHEDITFVDTDETRTRMQAAVEAITRIEERLTGRTSGRELPRVVLIGPPNAGKSSLFNALLNHPKAIVSDRKGTTRDWLSGTLSHSAVQVELIDTAGEDASTNSIEHQAAAGRELMRRHADLILCCSPANEEFAFEPIQDRRAIVVRTKCDLAEVQRCEADREHWVSIHEPERIDQLRDAIVRILSTQPGTSPASVSNRLRDGLANSRKSLEEGIQLLTGGAGEEWLVVALQSAIDHLGELVGAVYTEDLLDRIFSRFCIGK